MVVINYYSAREQLRSDVGLLIVSGHCPTVGSDRSNILKTLELNFPRFVKCCIFRLQKSGFFFPIFYSLTHSVIPFFCSVTNVDGSGGVFAN